MVFSQYIVSVVILVPYSHQHMIPTRVHAPLEGRSPSRSIMKTRLAAPDLQVGPTNITGERESGRKWK